MKTIQCHKTCHTTIIKHSVKQIQKTHTKTTHKNSAHLRVVDLHGASLALAVQAEEHLPRGLGEVQRHVQRADDPRVPIRQQVLLLWSSSRGRHKKLVIIHPEGDTKIWSSTQRGHNFFYPSRGGGMNKRQKTNTVKVKKGTIALSKEGTL